jgi:hypothetical protein
MLRSRVVAFTFRFDPSNQPPIERTRNLDGEADALAYGRQILRDWPDCETVEVVRDGELLERFRRRPV